MRLSLGNRIGLAGFAGAALLHADQASLVQSQTVGKLCVEYFILGLSVSVEGVSRVLILAGARLRCGCHSADRYEDAYRHTDHWVKMLTAERARDHTLFLSGKSPAAQVALQRRLRV
ncbi:hypothetical protein JIQ42_07362 [Leishmania sp. Namibia]|uniref:hypothetical protein n=1 Tax=Leishmania sp. Namibia TaxID=2802991 RepID=UPI001B55E59C|nr:hypothetical protein JIQ42_07362 [Leishmania sp. Namibia]